MLGMNSWVECPLGYFYDSAVCTNRWLQLDQDCCYHWAAIEGMLRLWIWICGEFMKGLTKYD